MSFVRMILGVCPARCFDIFSINTHSIAYLKQLKHESAICDRCMDRIQGEWFHCVYCPSDLCETCEALDTHNDTHFFVVFKSNIDMNIFK